LQKYVISYVHKVIASFEKYTCLFVYLNDENSDKKLLKKLINNKQVLSVIIAGHSYKYAQELKEYAQNIIFFAPQSIQHDFAAYNTFLSKLSEGECIVYGQLTQNIPFIVDVEEMELDLTQEDVFGEKEDSLSGAEFALNEQQVPDNSTNTETAPVYELTNENIDIINSIQEKDDDSYTDEEYVDINDLSEDTEVEETSDSEVIENILEDENEDETEESDLYTEESADDSEYAELTDEDLDFMDVPVQENEEDNLSEQDAVSDFEDFESLETNSSNEEDGQQIVPVYPVEEDEYEEVSDDNIDYAKGDVVNHPRYGQGTIEKIIKYGNKTLCSINFENVGRRLLDPSISEFERI